jgi:hypothetical protein
MSNTPRTGLAPEKPTIKILIYTDDPQIALTKDFGQFFGLGSMEDRLLAHEPTFATVNFQWFSRNSSADNHADNKLDDILSREDFDEIWFFGLHQSNTNNFSLLTRQGGPHSELEEDEIAALTEWMRIHEDGCGGGGILMTGDHANENPLFGLASTNGNHANPVASEEFLGLGRALGRGVPRAGALRKWEGPPTYHSGDSLSTIFNNGFQMDRLPQQLELRTVNVNGDPAPDGQPHPLFFYKEGRFIEFFPDHAHEGAVIVPDEAALTDHDLWPCDASKRQVLPQVVAFGTDARRPDDPVNIIATYNGDRAGVGRIVADSTWHHYMNLNLRGFPHPAAEGSPSDQIGQFYANLAVWLAPKCKREAMARLMFWKLARYTLLLEEQQDAESTGQTAQSVLTMAASPCEVHELIQVYTPTEISNLLDAGDIQLPSKEKLIGSVVKSYHDVMRNADAKFDPESIDARSVINAGFKGAFREHRGEVRDALRKLSGGSIIVSGTSACDDASEQWTIETLSDRRTGPSADNLYVFCVRTNAAGEISGTVSDGDSGDFLSSVTGTLTSLGGPTAGSSMSLEFRRRRVRVRISGVRIARNFVGTYTSSVAAAEAAATSTSSGVMAVTTTAPGDGDTGSASGTQT